MVITTPTITEVKSKALEVFDPATRIGFGTGTATPLPSDTDLTTPIVRKTFDETAIKNEGAGTYDFSANIGLTEENGNDFSETGLFVDASGGDMFLKLLFDTIVPKTSSVELSIGLRLNVEVTNE